ncbi:MAG: alkaline phosphatase [Deltaproteobacteria bacterium]|nr:MAG: alkaline phosphatase [Deltaproteobacteria bacterium]
MKRRTFLRITACTVAAGLLKSCGDDGGDAPLPWEGSPQPGDALFPQSVASGDPSPNTVILWTRLEDAEARASGEDVPLYLEVARDAAFEEPLALGGERVLRVTAEGAYDHCVKVRLQGLEPGMVLYYRFVVVRDGEAWMSRTGRTRTAPAPEDEVPVRFAFVSCQDYNGRYYHPYRAILDEDPDFVLHLGDYVYETTNDPGFQTGTEDRQMVFDDTAEAIVFNEGEEDEYHAAVTLEHYRTLYRTTRSDRDLQAAHERCPFVCTWDDHEFTNDAWGANGTYFNGRVDEEDVDRRKAASQAWFEYMPVDWPQGPDFRYDPEAPFPGDLIIYRDLRWGSLAHLLLPDVRTWRTEHLVDEGGFPGRVVMTEDQLLAQPGGLPDVQGPYIDLDAPENAPLRQLVADGAESGGYDPAHARGLVSVTWLDDLANRLDPDGTSPDVPRVPEDGRDELPRGIAFHHFAKTAPYSSLGARDLVVEEPLLRYSAHLWEESQRTSEDMLGPEQEAWFIDTMRSSTARWKIWGNAYPLSAMAVDLRTVETAPPALAQRFLMTAEDWAGMPRRRHHVLAAIADVENVLVCTGDRHAFLAATPHPDGDPDARVVEFVTGAVSSGTFGSIVLSRAQSDPTLRSAGAPALALLLRDFLLNRDVRANPHIAEGLMREHGFVMVELDADHAEATFHYWDEAVARQPEPPAEEEHRVIHFRVPSGSRSIERATGDGGWERWDLQTLTWTPVD